MKDSPTHTPYNGRNNDVLQLFQTGAGTISYVQAKVWDFLHFGLVISIRPPRTMQIYFSKDYSLKKYLKRLQIQSHTRTVSRYDKLACYLFVPIKSLWGPSYMF